jgi:hypothetical protein
MTRRASGSTTHDDNGEQQDCEQGGEDVPEAAVATGLQALSSLSGSLSKRGPPYVTPLIWL